MTDTPKQGWFKEHPVLSALLGIIIFGTIVNAFDSGDSGNYKANILNPTSTPAQILTATPTPTATIYKAPKTERQCHPSYSGCLNPNASDYDCAGGSGNGPYYTGRVLVYGYDEFGLDRDGDGIGCE